MAPPCWSAATTRIETGSHTPKRGLTRTPTSSASGCSSRWPMAARSASPSDAAAFGSAFGSSRRSVTRSTIQPPPCCGLGWKYAVRPTGRPNSTVEAASGLSTAL